MRPFLSDYILSLATKSQRRVQDILAAAQVSKEQIDNIATRLEDIKKRAPVIVRPEPYNGIISTSNIDSVYRDVNLRTKELYQESNAISLVLDGHSNILSSEIKKQGDKLDSFEKYIENYTFMMADKGFYDAAYTESFNDSIQKEDPIILNTMLSDRSRLGFDKYLEILDIDAGAGILTMSSAFQASFTMVPSIIRSNCLAYVTSDTGIENSVTSTVGDGWRAAISSARPITSSIMGQSATPSINDEKGAQFEIEYLLTVPSPCDTFMITPLSDLPSNILSLKVYSEDGSSYVDLTIDGVDPSRTESVMTLNKNRVFYFEQQIVSKVVLILNQPVYTRGKLAPSKSEQEYKNLLQDKRIERVSRPNRSRSQKAFQRLFNKWFLPSESKRASLVRPQARLEQYTDNLTAKDSLSYEKEALNVYSNFKVKRKGLSIFDKWVIDKLFEDQPDLLGRFMQKTTSNRRRDTQIPSLFDVDEYAAASNDISTMNYEYSLGIRNVKIGTTVNQSRGLFISKKVPVPVQSGEVRIKVDDLNYRYQSSVLDNPVLTTIEYSITTKSNPQSEEDWIPIIPSNYFGEEILERIFPLSSGYTALRIPASGEAGMSIFKNGVTMDLSLIEVIYSDDNSVIIGVKIPSQGLSFNVDDFYTARYLPMGDPTTVNFSNKGFQQKNLVSTYDENGAGERFNGTLGSNTISLANYAYVDYVKLESLSGYSTTLGLTGTYQPITILLDDGTIPYNYTNYNGLTQNKLDSSSSDYSFLHSRKQVIFNKSVDQGFRVFYQYEPSYLRYRVVFRINSQQKVSPYVNFITLKAKMNSSILGANSKKV